MLKALRISAFALVALLGVVGAEISQAVAEGFLVPYEDQMHGMVNQKRASNGLPSLAGNDALRTIGRRQSQAMAAAGYIYHTPDLRAAAQTVSLAYSVLGENVGVGPTVEMVQQAFIDSPHHYENIVDPEYNALGVGVVGASSGALYFSQNFAATRAASVPKAVAPPAQPRPQATARPATAPAGVAAVQAAQATAPPTPKPTPTPIDPVVARIPISLDRFPAARASATVFSARPGPASAAEAATASLQSVSIGATLGSMGARFLEKIAFWK